MFKTKLKKVAELTKTIAEKDDEITELKAEISRLTSRITEFLKLEDGTPADCKRGSWCGACEFSKVMHISTVWHGYQPVYFCGKGESCSNFVQKEV